MRETYMAHVKHAILRASTLVVLAGTAALATASGCTKASFKDECSVKNQKRQITVRGVFLRPHADLFLECDDVRHTFKKPELKSRGCELPFYTKEGGEGPPIAVFFEQGNDPHQLKPLPKSFDWHKDIHVMTDDGKTAELGDVVELTGELDTSYGDCDLASVTSVKLIEDKYGRH